MWQGGKRMPAALRYTRMGPPTASRVRRPIRTCENDRAAAAACKCRADGPHVDGRRKTLAGTGSYSLVPRKDPPTSHPGGKPISLYVEVSAPYWVTARRRDSRARGLGGSAMPVVLRGNQPLGFATVASEYCPAPAPAPAP